MTDTTLNYLRFTSGDSGLIVLDSQWRFVYVDPQLPQNLNGTLFWDAYPELLNSPFFSAASAVMERRAAASLRDPAYQVDLHPTPGGVSIHWSRLPAPPGEPPPGALPPGEPGPELFAAAGSLNPIWDSLRKSTARARRLAQQAEQAIHQSTQASAVLRQNFDETRQIQSQLQQVCNALIQAEARFNLSLGVVNEGFWDLDITTGRIWRSDSYTRIFNLPPTDPVPDSMDWFLERIHPDDRQRVETCFNAALASGADQWNCDYRFLPGDGTLRFVKDRAAIVRDETGKAVRATGAILDLTELKEKEAALHNLETQRLEDAARVEVQRKLLEQREMERVQLARDLHDGPIQSLSGLAFSLQMVREMSEDEALQDMLQVISRDIHSLVSELRGICNELRPPLLDKFGLAKALRTLADDFSERRTTPRLDLTLPEGPTPPVPGAVEIAFYRIFQEAVNNAAHHAQATTITASLRFTPHKITLTVSDDGRGFPTPVDWVTLTRQGHFGLVGIKERVEAITGALTLRSAPGEGTTIQVVVEI